MMSPTRQSGPTVSYTSSRDGRKRLLEVHGSAEDGRLVHWQARDEG